MTTNLHLWFTVVIEFVSKTKPKPDVSHVTTHPVLHFSLWELVIWWGGRGIHGFPLAQPYVLCVFNLEITKVSLLVLLTILWSYQSVISICFTNGWILHRQGLMMEKPPALSTRLVLEGRFGDHLLRKKPRVQKQLTWENVSLGYRLY